MQHNLQFYTFAFAPYALKYGLAPADKIIEPIFKTGLSKHQAIYLGVDENGTEWISENQKFAGVRLVAAQAYFSEHKKYSFQKFAGDHEERISAVQRALSSVGTSYDLVMHNCEHYATYVQTGKAESKQVYNAAVLVLSVFFIGFLFAKI